MDIYDIELGVPIKNIKSFFRREEFYLAMEQARLVKSFSKKYEPCYRAYDRCLTNNMLGFKISEGHKKVIYDAKSNPGHVIKIFKTPADYDSEKSYYDRLINYGLEKLVPKMTFEDQYSIVEKINPVSYIVWMKFLNRYCIIPENSGPVYSHMRMFKKASDLSVLEKIYKETITDTRPDFAFTQDRLVILHLDKIIWEKVEEHLEELKSTDFILD